MAEISPTYAFTRGERCIFAEIYFPRRVAHQGSIFLALENGHNATVVREYLARNVSTLIEELREYPFIFDPYRYRKRRPHTTESEVEMARKRIDLYRSPFSGWSMYQVDGVFINPRGRVYEEATQVIRIMFRKDSRYARLAEEADCDDVLRAIRFWAIIESGALIRHIPWGLEERTRFMIRHEPMADYERIFVEHNFEPIVKEAVRWIDDCALFVFGYLVRNFCESVLERNLPEEEIWVTSFFDLTVNRVRKTR